MAYSERARELRRCTATKPDGSPCRAWALWDDEARRCIQHAGRGHRGPKGVKHRRSERTHYRPCACAAYAWPHRPGGGVCRWPDPPILRLTTPAGTHSWPRMKPEEKALVRKLEWHGRYLRRVLRKP